MNLMGNRNRLVRACLSWISPSWCVLCFVSLYLGWPAPARAARTARAIYFSSHGAESLTIALDRIGILARDGARRDSLFDYAASLGLEHPDTLNSYMFTFRLPHEAAARESIVTFARTVKAGGQGVIAEAGLAVTLRGGRTNLFLTDKFIVQFRGGATKAQINAFNAQNKVEVVSANVLKRGHYLLKATALSKGDALALANLYHHSSLVRYAHPDFIHAFRYRQPSPPNDQRYNRQWYLNNVGQDAGSPQSQGTVDADIDWPQAWKIVSQAGAPSVTIAVMDGGFDVNHPDLKPDLWTNSGESNGVSGTDDDGNGFTDDLNGYDFLPCDGATSSNCGDGDPSVNPAAAVGSWEYLDDFHGTPVAGLVGAVMDNQKGVVGTCPNAKLMLIRRGFDEEHLALAFYYANRNGAKVISCSWGDNGDGTDTPTLNEAIDEVVSQGSVVLFAMDYAKTWDDCTRDGSWDLAQRTTVIAVGGSTNWDRKLPDAACGSYVDVLGPASRGSGELGIGYSGTLNIATTDVTGTGGYNSGTSIPGCPGPAPPWSDGNSYNYCFGGTSAATPIVAGVAGLILAVKDLHPVQVQRLLQDTADKIEPSEAAYGDQTGFSSPASHPASTHGFGRVNAFEAVRVVAPVSAGGKAGVDIFLRDNRLDWGNTEQPSNVTFEQTRGYEPHWESTDIKVDAGPDYQANPKASTNPSVAFDALVDENPVPGQTNRVYVRVRNRGPLEAHGVKVKLFWAYAGAAAPSLPTGFWAGFATNSFPSSEWTFIGERILAGNLPYSGSTVARDARAPGGNPSMDNAGIFDFFDWVGPPRSGESYRRGVNRFCLLAMVDSPDDPVLSGPPTAGDQLADVLVPWNNNVTLRNVHNGPANAAASAYSFYLRNPTSQAVDTDYRVIAPEGWGTCTGDFLDGRPARLSPGQKVLVSLMIGAPANASGDIQILQYSAPSPFSGSLRSRPPAGGLTIRIRAPAPAETQAPCRLPTWVIVLLVVLGLIIIVLILILIFR